MLPLLLLLLLLLSHLYLVANVLADLIATAAEHYLPLVIYNQLPSHYHLVPIKYLLLNFRRGYLLLLLLATYYLLDYRLPTT